MYLHHSPREAAEWQPFDYGGPIRWLTLPSMKRQTFFTPMSSPGFEPGPLVSAGACTTDYATWQHICYCLHLFCFLLVLNMNCI